MTIFRTKLERQAATLLLHDDFVAIHRWLCHPGKECEDGCDAPGIPERVFAYNLEATKAWLREEWDRAESELQVSQAGGEPGGTK